MNKTVYLIAKSIVERMEECELAIAALNPKYKGRISLSLQTSPFSNETKISLIDSKLREMLSAYFENEICSLNERLEKL